MLSSSKAAFCSARNNGVAREGDRGSAAANTGKERLCSTISESRGRSTSMPRTSRQIPRGRRTKKLRRSAAVSALPAPVRFAAPHGCASTKRATVAAVTASLTSVLRWTLIGTAPQAAGATIDGVRACESAW